MLTSCSADKEGVAIIMCEAELRNKYEALAQGRTLLESSLHLNLSEHINSEIGLGTIRNTQSAKEWLQNSFLFQRIQQNPRHYAIGRAEDQTWQERVGEMVAESVENLKKNQLISCSDVNDGALSSTRYGDIMSKVSVLPLHGCCSDYLGSTTSGNQQFVLVPIICITPPELLLQMGSILKLPARATLREMVTNLSPCRVAS